MRNLKKADSRGWSPAWRTPRAGVWSVDDAVEADAAGPGRAAGSVLTPINASMSHICKVTEE